MPPYTFVCNPWGLVHGAKIFKNLISRNARNPLNYTDIGMISIAELTLIRKDPKGQIKIHSCSFQPHKLIKHCYQHVEMKLC